MAMEAHEVMSNALKKEPKQTMTTTSMTMRRRVNVDVDSVGDAIHTHTHTHKRRFLKKPKETRPIISSIINLNKINFPFSKMRHQIKNEEKKEM